MLEVEVDHLSPLSVNQGKILPTILMPLPDLDVDPTESSIPWKILTARGMNIVFSTEHGAVAQGETTRLHGLMSTMIRDVGKVRKAYAEMVQCAAFQHPIPYAEINPGNYEALLLPGGDGPGMRQYLENDILRTKVLEFWKRNKPVGAICHGTLVLARTIDPETGKSVLYGRKVTALPKQLDKTGFRLDSWLGKHTYIMYPQCVEEEVQSSLQQEQDLSRGPNFLTPYVQTDGNLITSRWFNESQIFAERFAEML
jgi:putative intracellular protease/amidase